MKRRVLEKLKLTEISGVDRPCQQHATVAIMKRAADDAADFAKKLPKDADKEDYIHDFVNSDDPRFKGKSKKERIRMALGAYYGKSATAPNVDALLKQVDDLKKRVADLNKTWSDAARAAALEARRGHSRGPLNQITGVRPHGYKGKMPTALDLRRARVGTDAALEEFDRKFPGYPLDINDPKTVARRLRYRENKANSKHHWP